MFQQPLQGPCAPESAQWAIHVSLSSEQVGNAGWPMSHIVRYARANGEEWSGVLTYSYARYGWVSLTTPGHHAPAGTWATDTSVYEAMDALAPLREWSFA